MKLLWYLFQGTIFVGTVWACENCPDIACHPSDGHVIFFSVLVSYTATWVLSKGLDLLLLLRHSPQQRTRHGFSSPHPRGGQPLVPQPRCNRVVNPRPAKRPLRDLGA